MALDQINIRGHAVVGIKARMRTLSAMPDCSPMTNMPHGNRICHDIVPQPQCGALLPAPQNSRRVSA